MKRTTLTMFVILAFLAANPMAVQACQGCPQKSESQSKCKVTKLKKKIMKYVKAKDCLGLNNDQVAKLKSIKVNAMKDLIRQKADVDVIAVDVKSAMYAQKIDLKAVNKLVEAKYNAKKKMALTYVKAVADAQGVLTADQLAKTKDCICWTPDCTGCAKCAGKSSGKICPITGKSLSDKGSSKGSMK